MSFSPLPSPQQGVYMKQNPFGMVTDEELEAYKQEIEMKNNPALYAEWLRQQEAAAAVARGDKSTLDGTAAGGECILLTSVAACLILARYCLLAH